jgi:hypothetical protein
MAPAPIATVESQKRYIVTPSIVSPAFRARMVVDISASSGVKRGSPWGVGEGPTTGTPSMPNMGLVDYKNFIGELADFWFVDSQDYGGGGGWEELGRSQN